MTKRIRNKVLSIARRISSCLSSSDDQPSGFDDGTVMDAIVNCKEKHSHVVEEKSNEVKRLEKEIDRLTLELQDVFADLTSPEASSDEEEEDHVQQFEQNSQVLPGNASINLTSNQLMKKLLMARSVPIKNVPFSMIYTNIEYASKIESKMRRLRSKVTKANVATAIADEKYWREVARIEKTYPHDGGRKDLYYLVALYCYLDKMAKEESQISK